MILILVALNSRNETVPNDLKDKSVIEMLNYDFKARTEKSKKPSSHDFMHPIEHSPLTKLDNKPMIKTAAKLIKKEYDTTFFARRRFFKP